MREESLEIKLKISGDNEGTESPWWLIIDPKQNFNTNEDGLHRIANMITGPFFSRQEAEAHLKTRRYAFGSGAKVYCHSGYWSQQYKDACRNAKRSKKALAQ